VAAVDRPAAAIGLPLDIQVRDLQHGIDATAFESRPELADQLHVVGHPVKNLSLLREVP
jgi:hypothetical protein